MTSREQQANTKASGDAVVYSGKTNVKVAGNQVDNSMENAKRVVQNQFVGQRAAIDDLFIAFKRPLVAGVQKDKPKNTLVMIGTESIGKNSLIDTAISALKQEKLLNYSTVSKVDLSLYPTQSEKPLFLSDLYKALYASSDVIVFKDIEKCHAGMLGVISDLVITGKHQLGARYAMQNNNLIEATGVLMQNSISEISANNKYFIFVTQLSENKVSDLFGSKFMENVSDIIKFVPYSDAEISEIARRILFALNIRCKNHLSAIINYSEEFVKLCTSKYKKAAGFKPVEDFITKDIYKALSEYKLRNTMNANANIYLNNIDGAIGAVITEHGESKTVDLTPFLPKKNTSNTDEIKKGFRKWLGLRK